MFSAFDTLHIEGREYGYFRIQALEEAKLSCLDEMPFSIRVLLESVLRNCDGTNVTEKDVRNLAAWNADVPAEIEIPLKPARVILQDFTGVPAVVDLAAMRAALNRLGGDPKKVNPLIPVDLIIDHSIQTDCFASNDSLEKNVELEFSRNGERYSLLHWAQKSFSNFRVIPPSVGIIHQVNLEYLADVVMLEDKNGTSAARKYALSQGKDVPILYPDSVVGTDSHTVMINGLGVLGWGVGGIEAEAVMLGLPYYMLAPEVVGVELVHSLPGGVTATDLVLTMTQILRKEGVVGKFVEYYGPGAESMPVADRAVLANMAPEYGATMGFFPVDRHTIQFLRETGREERHVQIVQQYTKAQRLFRDENAPIPRYSKTLTVDLATVEPSLAGPKRPQDRVSLSQLKPSFRKALADFGVTDGDVAQPDRFSCDSGKNSGAPSDFPNEHEHDRKHVLRHGSLVIASITSCTNTSNPRLMLSAGLLAKKAVEKGLSVPYYVKTSLGPGSRVVSEYLKKANLLHPLEILGFHIVGYGCLTCIGNSGPLPQAVAQEITRRDLVVSAVLSGNRNFEGRINPLVKANYLTSPPLVVAFAIAGRTDVDLTTEPLGKAPDGTAVYLRDIWPSEEEIDLAEKTAIDPDTYRSMYDSLDRVNRRWNEIESTESQLYDWDVSSTYIREPPFLKAIQPVPGESKSIENARVLVFLGDSTTTDHISPAGAIKPDSPAGTYLLENGVQPKDFNSYGARRGNDQVMTRGTFANIRIRNKLVHASEGGVTKHFPSGEVMSVYDAAMLYRNTRTPLVVLAGAEYGTGSSRDWAAKGTALLGVRAVLAKSFERIHRGNLVGMGVLPLEFVDGADPESLRLDGTERYEIGAITPEFRPGGLIEVRAEKEVSPNLFSETVFRMKVRIDTPVELEYYLGGGILPSVLRKLY